MLLEQHRELVRLRADRAQAEQEREVNVARAEELVGNLVAEQFHDAAVMLEGEAPAGAALDEAERFFRRGRRRAFDLLDLVPELREPAVAGGVAFPCLGQRKLAHQLRDDGEH